MAGLACRRERHAESALRLLMFLGVNDKGVEYINDKGESAESGRFY